MRAVSSAVRDAQGSTLYMSVYNLIPGNTLLVDASKVMPEGSVLAVKEPSLYKHDSASAGDGIQGFLRLKSEMHLCVALVSWRVHYAEGAALVLKHREFKDTNSWPATMALIQVSVGRGVLLPLVSSSPRYTGLPVVSCSSGTCLPLLIKTDTQILCSK